ncbi:MAG: chromate transporter [Lentisphaeria bacterium]|nr:chromate transporter [Lentisphaeria bacterium]
MDTDAKSTPPKTGVGVPGISRRKLLLLLFFYFFRMSILVLGGGIALTLVAEDLFGKRLKWMPEGAILDHLPIYQSVPGLMACNMSCYIGYTLAGRTGAVVSIAGMALPSFLIISVLSIFFFNLPTDNAHVQGAFAGARSALTGLTIWVLIQSWKKSLTDAVSWCIFLGCFVGASFLGINPALLLLASMITGVILFYARKRREKPSC